MDPSRLVPRHRARSLARAVGAERAALRVLAAVRPAERRAQRDAQHMLLLIALALRADSDTVDVGAHTGEVLQAMVRAAPLGRHLAFEPLPHLATKLRVDYPHVDVRELALSDASGRADYVFVPDYPSHSGLSARNYPSAVPVERFSVETARLDDVLEPSLAPGLIKIDVEGAEGLVLAGAVETLRRHRPIVIFEFGAGQSHYGTTPQDVWDLLVEEAGLLLFDLDGVGPLELAGFRRMHETGERWNFVARP